MLAMIGMPRSGTTWVAKAIDSHPDTYYLHEPDSVKRMNIPQIISAEQVDEYLPYVNDYLKQIETVDSLKVVGRLPYYPKRYLNNLQLNFNRLSALTYKSLSQFFNSLAKSSPILIKPKKHHVTFWKSIESMGRVSVLSRANPSMKMLLLVRHPCAVINSELRGEAQNKFASKTPVYENWGLFENLLASDTAKQQQLTLEAIKQMRPAQRLAWKWRIFYEQLLTQAEQDNCILMQYEYLCVKPMQGFEELLQFFGLSFDQQVKDYLIASTSSHSDSYYSTSKDPLKAMQGWKSKLPEQDIADISEICQQHLNNEYWQS
ncbi:sulfotransferase [Neptunicella sp. SCSIO 80796]|uniref:sulfotransferase n=1 Tax=Neptunicella plasticusilytica TaxID=3117012 RepID=UPI003A4D41EA